MRSRIIFLLPALLLGLTVIAAAQWPTTLEENLIISGDPVLREMNPCALSYSDGRTLVVFWKDTVGRNRLISAILKT